MVDDDRDKYFSTDHLMADMRVRAVRGGALLMGGQSVKMLLQIISVIILMRILNPDDYGLYAMVVLAIGFIAMFKDLGLSLATIQRPKINHAQVSTLFWVNVGISVGLMVIIAAISPVIAWYNSEPRLVIIALVLAVEFPLGGLGVQHHALLRRQMRFGALVGIEIASVSLGVAAGVVSALYGAGYWALVFMRLTDTLIKTIGYWTLCSWRPGLPVRGSGVWSMIGFGGNITGFSLINYFTKELDSFLLGVYAGAHSLGIYSQAGKFAFKPTLFVNMPLREVAVPAMSRLISEPERYRKAYLKLVEKILMVTMPGTAFLIATADCLFFVLFKEKWIEASSIFVLLGIAALLMPIGNTSGWLFMTQDRTKDMLIWGFIDGAIKVVSIIIGIYWGVMGVATAVAIRTYLQFPLQCWFVGRKGPVKTKDFYRVLALPGLASLSILYAIYYVREWLNITNDAAGLLIGFGMAVVITLSVYLLFPGGRSVLKDLWNTIVLIFKRKELDAR